MRSPFAIFRKHQKLMTVVLTGLAMFAFVILGAVNDPSNMPPALIVVFVACMFGSIGWMLGIRSKKSSEFGFAGLIVGTVVSVGAMLAIGEPVRVKADTGNLNEREFNFLQLQRAAANQFLTQAVLLARQKSGNQYLRQPAPFRFHADPDRDIVIGELLRREAHDLGILVTDAMVNDYIKAITQEQLGAPDIRELRNAMGLGESDLYNILRSEIQARLAAQYLYSGTTLPPEAYWEFYRQLNVRQSVGIVPVSVRSFIDESAEPSESELQQLFDAHRENFPDTSDEGRLKEGRPGFRQPRKVRLAYVEATYEEVEKRVEPPTDVEIEAFYNEHYKSLPADEFGTETDGSSDESTTENGSSSDEAAGPALSAPDEELPDGRIDGEDLPPGEDEEIPKSGDRDDGAFLPAPSQNQFVVFLDDDTDDETDTDTKTDTDTPDGLETTEAEEVVPDSAAADNQTVEEDSPDEDPSVDLPGEPVDLPGEQESELPNTPPPPPLAEPSRGTSAAPGLPAVPVLDDDLRGEIRDQILRERTDVKMQEVLSEADVFVRDLELRLVNLPDDAEYLTRDQAREKLRAYAQEKGLVYAETPLLSYLELLNSEEYPIGSAVDRLFSDPFNPRPASTVVDQVFDSAPREVYRSRSVVQPETDSRFVYWKIKDQAEFVPQSLSDPGIREQVVSVWREIQAREKAQTRATELAKMAEGTDKPLSEVLADETVTGESDTTPISVLHPPMFSWMSKASPGMSPNPFNPTPPERTRLRNIPGRIGDSFMKTVFDELKAGEVGVAHSIDKDYFYVVRVDQRSYGFAPDMQAFRERFIKEQLFAPYYISDYPFLAQNKLREFQTDWSKSLFKKHAVQIMEREEEQSPDEEADLSQ